jgi:hypothetical protein
MHGSRRLESERPPLVWPCHRHLDETLEAVTTWQSSLDSGLDDVGGEEGERQRHPDRTGRGVFVPLAFMAGEAFQFDWSEDWAIIAGERTKLQVAHFKLS